MSPEVLAGRGSYPGDIWSLGMTMVCPTRAYAHLPCQSGHVPSVSQPPWIALPCGPPQIHMLTGKPPWSHLNLAQVANAQPLTASCAPLS